MKIKREVLSLKEQYRLIDVALKDRIKNLLPKLMKKNAIDMWVILCAEYNEDPAFNSLVPCLMKTARRLSGLVFYLNDKEEVEAYNVGRPYPELGEIYKPILDVKVENTFECVARLISEKQPETIGLNFSNDSAQCDGISKTIYDALMNTLPNEAKAKITSAQYLCADWLGVRTKQELARYHAVYALAVDIIDQAYSTSVIKPGKTTTTDVEWFLMEAANLQGLPTWFRPTVSLQRKGCDKVLYDELIVPGDLLHCDFGIKYLGLCTDTQRLAYVPHKHEKEVPQGLLDAISECHRFEDIVASHFKCGRAGNEVLSRSLEEAKKEGLIAMLYTHPIGVYGHGVGANIGMFDNQTAVKPLGDYKLAYDTCFALELNTFSKVSCWNNQPIWVYLEETVTFTEDGISYLDFGRKDVKLVK